MSERTSWNRSYTSGLPANADRTQGTWSWLRGTIGPWLLDANSAMRWPIDIRFSSLMSFHISLEWNSYSLSIFLNEATATSITERPWRQKQQRAWPSPLFVDLEAFEQYYDLEAFKSSLIPGLALDTVQTSNHWPLYHSSSNGRALAFDFSLLSLFVDFTPHLRIFALHRALKRHLGSITLHTTTSLSSANQWHVWSNHGRA